LTGEEVVHSICGMKLRARIRETLGGYLGKHEARMASKPVHRYFIRGAALLLDLAAAAVLVIAVSSINDAGGGGVGAAMIILGVLAAAPIFAAVAVMIPAMAGEKQNGTLESLMLAPVSRTELLWAKLLGRMATVRGFMWAALPAFVFCCVTITFRISLSVIDADISTGATAAILLIFMALGAALAVGLWIGVLVDAHCAAAMALYCSARTRSPVTASVLAYTVVFVPAVAMSCCYGAGLPYHFVAGPIMFSELVRNLDRLTIEIS
jgi:ABC-type Na+ efflux pump permease subunit